MHLLIVIKAEQASWVGERNLRVWTAFVISYLTKMILPETRCIISTHLKFDLSHNQMNANHYEIHSALIVITAR